MKCTNCNSCTVLIPVDNKMYNICKLCKKVWKVVKKKDWSAEVTELNDEERDNVLNTINLNVL